MAGKGHGVRRTAAFAWLILAWWVGVPFLLEGAEKAAGERWVRYENGQLSFAFEETPVGAALAAISEKTGIRIVLLPGVEEKAVSLRVEGVLLETGLRHLLRAVGLASFAIVYEEQGSARQLIIVEPGTAEAPSTALPVPPAGQPVYIPPKTEPIYIPPRTEAIYIPPATPPEYIPPREEPVYIPSREPPAYIPPVSE